MLLPAWQGQVGLDHASLAVLRTLYTGALAALWAVADLGAAVAAAVR